MIEESRNPWIYQVASNRPRLALLTRSGDGSAALALILQTSAGGAANVALAALLEARLEKLGIHAEGRGDRNSVRLVVLEQNAAAMKRAISGMSRIVLSPVSEADGVGIKLAAARVAMLRTWSLEDARLEDFAVCTGEPSIAPGVALPLLEGAEGIRQIETWRKGILASRSALGAVGTSEEIEVIRKEFEIFPEWPEGDAPILKPFGPMEDAPVVYGELGRKRKSYRVSVAAWFPDTEQGPQVAKRLGDFGASIDGRLEVEQARLRRVVGVTHQGGSCVLASAEGNESQNPEQEAALVAATLQQEIFGSSQKIEKRISAPEDPREAAVAGAWRLLAPKTENARGEIRWRVALGIASTEGEAAQGKKFQAAWEALQQNFSSSAGVLESKVSQEKGQGRVWMLLASSCPVSEVPGEHGITALSLLASLKRASLAEGITLEPWLNPGGAGVLAMTSPRSGETPVMTSQRLADTVGRVWLGAPPSAGSIQEARGVLLGRLGESPSFPPELWSVLAPDFPGRLWVGGSTDGVARPGVKAVQQRWKRLVTGPLRVAMLVDQGLPQSDAALLALKRWIPPSVQPKECISAPLGPLGAGGALLNNSRQAFLVFRVNASGRAVGSLAVTALLLDAPGKLLSKALEGSGAFATSRVVGQGAESGFVIELQGPHETLEGAIERVRAVFERLPELAKGVLWEQARDRWEQLEQQRMLEPRERLSDVWNGATRPAIPEEASWLRWVQEQLSVKRAVVLRPKP